MLTSTSDRLLEMTSRIHSHFGLGATVSVGLHEKLTVFPADIRKKASAPRLAKAESLVTPSLVYGRLAVQHVRINQSLACQLATATTNSGVLRNWESCPPTPTPFYTMFQ